MPSKKPNTSATTTSYFTPTRFNPLFKEIPKSFQVSKFQTRPLTLKKRQCEYQILNRPVSKTIRPSVRELAPLQSKQKSILPNFVQIKQNPPPEIVVIILDDVDPLAKRD